MKRFCFLAIAVALGITAAAQADDPPAIPRAPLASGANLGQLSNLGLPTTGGSPFSNGLGQIVSGWTQQGIHGQELADRVHWLQSMRADEIAQRTRWMDQRRFDQNDGFGDIREDRREIRNDERRLARDREDLRRDLRNRDDRFRDRDIREDRREIREDERRLARDREDLGRDLADRNREERVRDRNPEDNGLHRGWRDHEDNGLHRGWDKDRDDGRRDRDRDDRGTRDHDPRRDRDDRRGDRDFTKKGDRDDRHLNDRGHDHNATKNDDPAKHIGAQGGHHDNPAGHHLTKDDAKTHTVDHHSHVPSPTNGNVHVPSGGKGGKGKK
jgi:hypothetical protein